MELFAYVLLLFLVLLVAGFLLAIIRLSQFHAAERKDMLDRLMARNLVEFKDNAAPEPNHFEPTPTPEIVSLDEAREELADGQ